MFVHLFRCFRAANTQVQPKYFMSDKDFAQLSAIESVFEGCLVLLCWRHVLEAWKKHTIPLHYPTLWRKLDKLLRAKTREDFDTK